MRTQPLLTEASALTTERQKGVKMVLLGVGRPRTGQDDVNRAMENEAIEPVRRSVKRALPLGYVPG